MQMDWAVPAFLLILLSSLFVLLFRRLKIARIPLLLSYWVMVWYVWENDGNFIWILAVKMIASILPWVCICKDVKRMCEKIADLCLLDNFCIVWFDCKPCVCLKIEGGHFLKESRGIQATTSHTTISFVVAVLRGSNKNHDAVIIRLACLQVRHFACNPPQ